MLRLRLPVLACAVMGVMLDASHAAWAQSALRDAEGDRPFRSTLLPVAGVQPPIRRESDDLGGNHAQVDSSFPTCPPGQFPSTFSDVLPSHWAYDAVNRLASRPIQCFDLPDQMRDRPDELGIEN